mgnify:CR=1 FL=1
MLFAPFLVFTLLSTTVLAAPPPAVNEVTIRYSDPARCRVQMSNTAPYSMPWIHFLVSEHSYSLFGFSQQQLKNELIQALQRGCSIEERDLAGLTPLQAAIMFNDAEMADLLLKHGADPYALIDRGGKPSKAHGKNSFEFFELLEQAEAGQARKPSDKPFRDRSRLKKVLQDYRNR